ncbi:Flagellar hook-length control protein FliK [compost metagenome]
MPLASNPLLQATAVASSLSATAGKPDKAVEAGQDKASGFAQVYAQQSAAKPAPAKAASDTDDGDEQSVAAGQPAIADDGKTLPDEAPVQAADETAAVAPADLAAGPVAPDPQAFAAALAPAQPPASFPEEPEELVDADFDPSSDPLANLPVVRMALEQNAQAQGKTSAHAAQANGAATTGQPETLPGSDSVNGLAALLDQQAKDSTDGEPGDDAFSGLLDDGLKDLKGAASDTRVDNFAERLGALTQAATAKTANAVPMPAPLNQPLAMHQGGWTEGLVNRVMYLSSQNLKSAEIQLQPAELGRLDIRVHMAPDQQAQVAFSSGHAGVREALEGQVQRLKDGFAEQGLGQLNVSVSDQPRDQDRGREAQRGSASSQRRGDGGDGVEAASPVVEAAASSVVLGSSMVDFYA